MTSITRLFDFPYHQLEKYNIQDALVTKQNGVWVKTSTQEYLDKANTKLLQTNRLWFNHLCRMSLRKANFRFFILAKITATQF